MQTLLAESKEELAILINKFKNELIEKKYSINIYPLLKSEPVNYKEENRMENVKILSQISKETQLFLINCGSSIGLIGKYTTHKDLIQIIYSNYNTRSCIDARNENIPSEILKELALDHSYLTRMDVAKNKSTDIVTLDALSYDNEPSVRAGLVCNPNSTPEMLERAYNLLSGSTLSMHDMENKFLSHKNTPQSIKNLLNQKSKKSNCYIATATYGSSMANEVELFRIYRDEILSKYWTGRKFISLYYFLSPPIANFISKSEKLKIISRNYILEPMIRYLKLDKTAYNKKL